MKNFIFTVFFSLLCLASIYAQNSYSVYGYGGEDWDLGYDITADAEGNIYTTGYFSKTTDFDNGPGILEFTSEGLSDIFVMKQDADCNLLWAAQIGGKSWDGGRSIKVDAVGNVFVTGRFTDTVDFDPGPATYELYAGSGTTDAYVLKLDAAGNFLWVSQFKAGQFSVKGTALDLDEEGNIYATGIFGDTADFDPGPDTLSLTSAGLNDIYLVKLDNSGNLLWADAYGGIDHDIEGQLTVANSSLYLTGAFEHTIDFGTQADSFNLVSTGDLDAFVAKFSTDGDLLWTNKIGGISDDAGNDILVDEMGDLYLTGYFSDSIDFDLGLDTFGLMASVGKDAFVLKMDTAGGFKWARQLGGSHGRGFGLTVDSVGNVYTVGDFGGTIELTSPTDTFGLSTADWDAFILKLDQDGTVDWAGQIAGNDIESAHSVALGNEGNLYTTGGYWFTVDFAPGPDTLSLTSNGGYDIFIHKISFSDVISSLSENPEMSKSLSFYPNPTAGMLRINLGKRQERMKISTFNSLGQILDSQTIEASAFFDLKLKGDSGIYFVHLETEGGETMVLKVLKGE